MLKYERLKREKNFNVRVLGFFFFFFLKDKIFADERRRKGKVSVMEKARLHAVTRLIGVVPHWHARIRLFTLFLVF